MFRTLPAARRGLALSIALFGLGWPFTKIMLSRISALPFLAAEVSGCALCAWIVVYSLGIPRPGLRATLAYTCLGILSPGVNYALAIGGLAWTSASAASLASSIEPPCIILLSLMFLKERLSWLEIASVGLAVGGAILIANPWGLDIKSSLGCLGVMVGVMAGALMAVLQRRAPEVDLLVGLAIQMTAAAAFLLAATLIAGSGQEFFALPMAWRCGIVTAGPLLDYLPFFLYFSAGEKLPSTEGGMAFYLMPVWGIFGSMLLLGEHPSLLELAGGYLVFLAVSSFSRLRVDIVERV